MKTGWVLSMVFALSVFAASTGGSWYGYRMAANVTVNDWAIEQAQDIQGHLSTLRLLRHDKSPEALESLESRLDNDLAILEPQAPTITLEPGVRKQVDKAFLDAANYRAEHPRTAAKTGAR